MGKQDGKTNFAAVRAVISSSSCVLCFTFVGFLFTVGVGVPIPQWLGACQVEVAAPDPEGFAYEIVELELALFVGLSAGFEEK